MPTASPSKRTTPFAAAAMTGATLFWAGHYLLSPVALQSMTPVGLTWYRWLIAAAPLLVMAQLMEHPDWRAVLRQLPRIAALAGLGILAYNLLLYSALATTTSIGASIINAANPAVMVALAALLVREAIPGRRVLGIVVSLLGVLIVISQGSLATLASLHFNQGQLLMLGAVLAWSVYSIYARVPGVGPITSTAVQTVIVVVALAPFAAIERAAPPTDPAAIWVLIFIALLPSVGSYLLWNLALRTTPTSGAAIYMNLVTVFTVAIGAAFGQPVSAADLIGGAAIILGVVVTSLAPSVRHEST